MIDTDTLISPGRMKRMCILSLSQHKAPKVTTKQQLYDEHDAKQTPEHVESAVCEEHKDSFDHSHSEKVQMKNWNNV